MSGDRASISTHHHHTRRWSGYSLQRTFLVVMLCLPLTAHAEDETSPSMPGMPAGHSMHGGMAIPQNGAMPRSGKPDDAPQSPSPSDGGASLKPGFAPNISGPSLPPSIPEEQANQNFGVEGVLASARATTAEINRTLPQPVGLPRQFTGPLWTVKTQKRSSTVSGYGSVEINEDTLHDAVVTQSGVVRELYVFPGMEVKAGDPLISIFSPERVNAQHMLLADFSKDEGNQISLQYYSSFSSTEKYLEQSRSNLRWWGFSDADIDTLLKTQQVKEDYVFQVNQDSYVIETIKNPGSVVVAGDKSEENFVIPGEQIMRMASLDSVWGMSFVNPADDAQFKVGDALRVTVGEGAQAKTVDGLIVHKHDNADPTTRKDDFHVLLENKDRKIYPGSLVGFSRQVPLNGLWVPAKAFIYVAGQPTLIRKSIKGYEAVSVTVGSSSGEFCEILAGLNEGDLVVAAPRAELDPDARIPGLAEWE